MSLLDQIAEDIRQIASNGDEFAVEAFFQAPGGQEATVNVIATKFGMAVDAQSGTAVNSKSASLSVSEKTLTDAGYTVRNANNEVALIKHKVSWTDSSGTTWKYQIRENIPDETIGLIVCILSDYKE
jgi:hypothetical protein